MFHCNITFLSKVACFVGPKISTKWYLDHLLALTEKDGVFQQVIWEESSKSSPNKIMGCVRVYQGKVSYISYWKSIRLEMRMYKQEYVQKDIWTMLGARWSSSPLALPFIAWSEMVSYSPCFAFYCFSSFPWIMQTIWDNLLSLLDQRCGLILTLLYLMPLPLHFYCYEQSNAPPSTLSLCK